MQYLAVLLILFGLYLVNSGIKNRDPVGFINALVSSKKPDLRATLAAFDGKWTEPQVFETPAISGAGKTVGDIASKGLPASNNPRNGRLDASELTRLSWNGIRVANSAAPSLEKLNKAFAGKFGRSLSISGGYRTYAEQVAVKAAKGSLAATPGTSNHGLGLAVDFSGGVNSFKTNEYGWMAANAPAFGWVNPEWARQGGSKPEPWHWEFVGGSK